MIRKVASLLAVLVALLVSACSSVPTNDIAFKAEADPKVRFAGYQKYAWLAEAAILRDPEGHWERPSFDAGAEIKFLIDRELRGRGLTEDASNPDLYVAFALGIDMAALKLKTDPETKMEVMSRVPSGGLLTALVDADTGFVAWGGVATGELHKDPDDETVKARLDYAVTQLLKKVPK